MIEDIDNEEIKGLTKEGSYTDRLPRGYMSVSQVTQYKKCGMAYYFRYVLEVPIRRNSFQAQGTAVHAGGEQLHLSLMTDPIPPPLGYVEAAYEGALDRLFDEDPDLEVMEEDVDQGHIKDVGMNLIRTYYKGALGELADPDDESKLYRRIYPVAAERKIRTMIEVPDEEPVPFLGIVDLEEPSEIGDMKVKRKLSPQSEADNSLQLSLYAHLTGKSVVRIDQLIKPTKRMPVRYIRRTAIRTPQEKLHAIRITSETAKDISKGRFPLTMPDNWWCTVTWCPYWDRCRGKKT